MAIQLDGPDVVAVAEHPAVVLGAELGHLGRLVFGGQDCGLVFVVEGFGFLGDAKYWSAAVRSVICSGDVRYWNAGHL
ncbi:hypothetical protein ACFWAY_41375 [Rhodococcus sp. NPDC059968]|uniref:hypothetical protein n=1 Tax=Rhodococcus sp. NPDC059968 TaxID=3347017 RepID=UPI00366B11EA